MAKSKKCFIVFFLAVIFSAWLPFSGGTVLGEVPVRLNSITLETLFMKSAQPSIEAVWNRIFGLRNAMVILKNTLFDHANFMKFHHNRDILEGRDRMMFSYPYFETGLCGDQMKCMKTLDGNVEGIKELKERLAAYGIPVYFVLLPSKTHFLKDDWPFLWKKLYRKSSIKIDWYTLYEKKLTDAGVPVLDLNKAMLRHKKDRDSEYYFPKGGNHWTLAGAGAVLPELAAFLNRHSGSNLRVPDKRIAFTDRSLHGERDISNHLNAFPIHWDGEKYPYYEYGKAPESLPLTWYGDSYGHQITTVLAASGLTPEKDLVFHWNRFLNKKLDAGETYAIVEKNAPFVLGYTIWNFKSDRLKKEADYILKLLDAPYFAEGWHQLEAGQRRWTSDKAVTKFLSDGTQSFFLTMKLESKMPKIGSFSASVNGTSLGDVTVHGKIGQTLEIPLPKALLKKGVNTVRFDIPGAVKARTMTMSADDRTRGLYLSEIEIRPAP